MRIIIKNKKKFMEIFNSIYPSNQLKKINGISIDSRKIMSNDIFFPIKGNRYNGHDYLKQVLMNNSITCFSENKKYGDKTIICESSKNEIIKLAKLWRKHTKSKIIAITGSNGKTTLKEMLFHILCNKYSCSKSSGNYNTTLGLPLAFLNSKLDDDYCILELGASLPDEIKILSKIFKPDMAIVTNISKAHIGNFKSFNNLIKTKNQIFNDIQPNGNIFINKDDQNIQISNKNETLNNSHFNKYSYAFNENKKTTYKGKIITKKRKTKLIINIKNNQSSSIIIPENIKHLESIILAAYSISNILGINNKNFQHALESFELPKGRGQIIKYNKCKIIDDTYNANPSSMKLGLDRVSNMQTEGKKIIVLGDMLELGKNEIKEHEKLGELINLKKIDVIITFGNLMKNTFKKITHNKSEIFHFTDFKKLNDKFHSIIKKNDLIYIKGSRSMYLERLYL